MGDGVPFVQVEEVVTLEALEALRPEWTDLWERCPSATPFQSPEWLLTWWKHFGGNMLWVLALRGRGRLVGLAPFFIHYIHERKKRQVSFIGTDVTDYLDVLLDPDFAAAGAESTLNYLALQRARWDICDLRNIRPDSPLMNVSVPSSLQVRLTSSMVCPVLSLPGTVEEFYSGLPAGYRMRVQRARTLMERAGDMRVEIADEETLPDFLDVLFRLHRAHWIQRNLGDVLSRYDIQAFHWEAAAGLLKRGCLRLYVLRRFDMTIAALYAFAFRNLVYCYLGGIEPEMRVFSPGTVITGYAIEDAIRSGCREFDFLRGNESCKYIWGARERRNRRMLIWQKSRRHGESAAFL